MAVKNTPHWIEWIVLLPNRLRVQPEYRRRERERDGAIAAIRTLVNKAATFGFNHTRTINNVSLYILVLDQDLAMLKRDMLFAVGHKRRVFVSRALAIQLYEASQDLPQLTGASYRESLRTLNVPHDWVEELNAISKQLNQFKIANREFLGNIRNLVGAHRENDAIAQLDAIDSIEPLELMQIHADLWVPLNLLVTFQIKLTAYVGKMDVLARELLSKSMPASKVKNSKSRRRR